MNTSQKCDPTDLIIVQTTDLFIYSFIFTCGDFL